MAQSPTLRANGNVTRYAVEPGEAPRLVPEGALRAFRACEWPDRASGWPCFQCLKFGVHSRRKWP